MSARAKAVAGAWGRLAERWGWVAVAEDPAGGNPGQPCLYHAGTDRVWPLNDPRGALRDLWGGH